MQPFNPQAPAEGRKRAVPLHARNLPEESWSTPRTVRFSDCDPAGIVYTPCFIDMVNGVIEDFFVQRLRISYHGLMRDEHVGLGYASVDTDFFKPALMGERLHFTPLVERIGRTSIIFSVHCIRDVHEIMRCRLVMVTTALATHQPISIPAPMRDTLSAYQDLCR